MSLRIAVAGKGGTGKSTLSGLLCRALIKQSLGPVLAVDADPNSCLPEKLGIAPEQTIGELREQLRKHPEKKPASISKSEWMEMGINGAISEASGVDMVVMGRQEGPDCYCFINNLLRHCLDTISDQYKSVVIDNEAGLEHLSRRSNGTVEVLLVVANPTVTGVRTTARIVELIKSLDLNIGATYLVINKADGEVDPALLKDFQATGIEVAGTVPSDQMILDSEMKSESLLDISPDSKAAQSVEEILKAVKERRSS